MSSVDSVLYQLRELLGQLEAISQFHLTLTDSNERRIQTAMHAEAIYQHQIGVIDLVFNILEKYTDHRLIRESAIEAYVVVLSRRYLTGDAQVLLPSDTSCDHLKLGCASITLGFLCSKVEDKADSLTMDVALRLILPVADFIVYIADDSLKRSSAMILGSLLCETSSQNGLLSAQILTHGFIFTDSLVESSTIFTKAIDAICKFVFTQGKRSISRYFDTTLEKVFIIIGNTAEYILWLLRFVHKLLNTTHAIPIDSNLTKALPRLMRMAVASSRSDEAGADWCQVLLGSVELVEVLVAKNQTGVMTFEIIDELIEQLRFVDDRVVEAALHCLKAFCCDEAWSEKFFAFNCHVTAFKALSESLPTYLQMNWKRLLKPCFEIFDALMANTELPDSTSASQSIIRTTGRSLVIMDQLECHLAIRCVARLFQCHCATLALVYDDVSSLIPAVVNISKTSSTGSPDLLISAGRLANVLAENFDWPGLRAILANGNFVEDILVSFATKLIGFTGSTIEATTMFLANFPPDFLQWLPLRPVFDAAALCLEACFSHSLLAPLLEQINSNLNMFLEFKSQLYSESHSTFDVLIRSSVYNIIEHEIDNYAEHATALNVDTTLLSDIKANQLDMTLFSDSLKSLIEFPSNRSLAGGLLIASCCGSANFLSSYASNPGTETFLWTSFVELTKPVSIIPIVQMELATSFLIEIAFVHSSLMSARLEKEIDSILAMAPLWYLVQPVVSAWALIRASSNCYTTLHCLLEAFLTNESSLWLEKWARTTLSAVLGQLFESRPVIPGLATAMVCASLQLPCESQIDHRWSLLCLGIFGLDANWLQELKNACITDILDTIATPKGSRPTNCFLYLATICLCGWTNASERLLEYDRLSLSSYICRLINLCQDADDSLRLNVLNLFNSVLIICAPAFDQGSKSSQIQLRNLILTLASNEALRQITETNVTGQLDNLRVFCASLVTITWLWRLCKATQMARQDQWRELQSWLLSLCNNIGAEKCCGIRSKTSSVKAAGCCVNGLLTSLMLNCSSPHLATLCRDFSKIVPFNRFVTNAVSVTALVQGVDNSDSGELTFDDSPWLALSKISVEVEQNCDQMALNSIWKPFLTDGVVAAYAN